jgi:hypothetical protein
MAYVEDTWVRLFRDLLVRAVGLSLVTGGLLWVAELPAASKLPGVTLLPRLSDYPFVNRIPPAATVFGIAVPAAIAPRVRKPHPRKTPEAIAAAPSLPEAMAAPTAAAPTPLPEATVASKASPVARKLAVPAPGPRHATGGPRHSTRGVQHIARRVLGVPVHVVSVDLLDPSVVGTLVLAKNAEHPNTALSTVGDEEFDTMVDRTHAAVAINGTFFSKDNQKRVMGNMVRHGNLIKFSQWDHDGTTFWLGASNRPGMITPSAEGNPPWEAAWIALSCGPRLLRRGESWSQPATEGFHDSHVLGTAGRSALGFDAAGRQLFLVSFDGAVDLAKEAAVMKGIGCAEAMNLDGGASRSLALGGHVVVPAGRPLTNVLAFYDKAYPAPTALIGAFSKFHP